MKTNHHGLPIVIALILASTVSWGQSNLLTYEKTATQNNELMAKATSHDLPAKSATQRAEQKIVIITGARFTYPLVQKWIDDYNTVNQEVQIVIESRGTSDPAQYDILIDAYEPAEEVKKTRDYLYIARYAVLPVANSSSAFAKEYTDKGLDQDLIKQLFFHDIFSDKENQKKIEVPYTIYTRLQKAGVPITFTGYFGFQQKDIKGKVIAGSDEHLLKAVLRDSTSITYFPLSVIYDHTTGKPHPGLVVLPVDLNGNDRVTKDEKFYDELPSVIQVLEGKDQKELNNVPIGNIHLSVNKKNANPEAIAFLRWVLKNGQANLSTFGFLKPEPSRSENQKQEEFLSKSK
jgi:phosphate transport system substrate-binding protein